MRTSPLVIATLAAFAVLLLGCGSSKTEPETSKASEYPRELGYCRTIDGRELGVIPKSGLRKVVHANVKAIRTCLETHAEPGESGRVAVKFTIVPDGTIGSAEIQSSTLENERVEACMIEVAKEWRFSPRDCEGDVTVTYPFQMALPLDNEPSQENPKNDAGL